MCFDLSIRRDALTLLTPLSHQTHKRTPLVPSGQARGCVVRDDVGLEPAALGEVLHPLLQDSIYASVLKSLVSSVLKSLASLVPAVWNCATELRTPTPLKTAVV